MANDPTQLPTLRLPAAGLRFWPDESRGDSREVMARVAAELTSKPGTFALDQALFAVTPAGGDPAVFDCAVAWSRDLLRQLSPSSVTGRARPAANVLIFPTAVMVSEGKAEILPEPLLEGLDSEPPRLSEGGIYLTTRASHTLEHPLRLERAGEYRIPTGPVVPLVRAAPELANVPPWRNPELFGRRVEPVMRTRLQAELSQLLRQPACRVEGGLGLGKTRLVWETLARRREPKLWLRARPERRRRPPLGEQLLRALLEPKPRASLGDALPGEIEARLQTVGERPRRGEPEGLAELGERALAELARSEGRRATVVVDDVQMANGLDLRFISNLVETAGRGESFRVVLVGRSAPDLGLELPVLEVPALEPPEMQALAGRLVEGLSLPDAVRGRILEASACIPFAFEEGLFGLLHERTFRRIYGSFFFGGNEETEYRPSLRLVRHLAAEGAEMDDRAPLLLLSLAEPPLPADELVIAAQTLGGNARAGWEAPLIASGLLEEVPSFWDRGLRFRCPAYRYATSFIVPEDEAQRARRMLGDLLAARGGSGEAYWQAYQLLAGSEEAADALVEVVQSSYAAQIPRERLLDTINGELARLREHGRQPEVELQLLWRLLPIARRLGRLHQFQGELARGVELAASHPQRLLALASLKAEMEQEAGEFRAAEATLRGALSAATGKAGRRQALLLVQLGKLFLRHGRFDEAKKIFDGLLEALTSSGQAALGATCRFFLGNIALQQGRVEDAFDHHQAALDERRDQGLSKQVGSSLSALGAVSLALGNYPQALEFYERARDSLEEHGGESEVAFALLGIGRARTRLGDYTGATGPIRRALALREGRDDVAGEALARLAVAENHFYLSDPERALRHARQAHFQLSLLSLEESLAEVDQLLGRILIHQRKFAEATRHLATALDIHQRRGEKTQQAFDQAWLLAAARGRGDEAGVQRHAADLKGLLAELTHPELGEILWYMLYGGLDWLMRSGHKVGDPTPYLERSYRRLLAKARHLDVDARHRFLFQIPINQEIVNAAAQRGLSAEVAEG